MEAKGEHGEARLGVEVSRSGEQRLANGGVGPRLVEARQAGQLGDRPVHAGKRPRDAADQAPRLRLRGHAEGLLDPGGERVFDEGRMIGREGPPARHALDELPAGGRV